MTDTNGNVDRDEDAEERTPEEEREAATEPAAEPVDDAEAVDPEGDATGAESDASDADEESEEDLVDRVAAHDEALADEVATLEERAEEADDLTDRLKRAQADFQNYKKRQQKRQERLERRATESLVERLLDVRDNLARALDAEEGDGVREGVEATLREFDRVLDDENVEPIEPDPGEATDPERHEVLMRVDADHPEGTIAEVYRAGYEMGGKVLRTAQVTVSDGSGDGE